MLNSFYSDDKNLDNEIGKGPRGEAISSQLRGLLAEGLATIPLARSSLQFDLWVEEMAVSDQAFAR